MDTSKRLFQLHGVDASEQVALRRQLTRAQVLPFFERLPARWWRWRRAGRGTARELRRLGHEVRLIAPQLAQPYVARGKNDAADAAALCEAASRPQMRFVPAKTADQQAALMLAGQRERRVAPAHPACEHHPRPWGRVWLRRRPALDGDPRRRPADRLAPGDEDAGPASPREHSTAGKARPGRITRAGDPMLRSLLVVGATAVIWQTRRGARTTRPAGSRRCWSVRRPSSRRWRSPTRWRGSPGS